MYILKLEFNFNIFLISHVLHLFDAIHHQLFQVKVLVIKYKLSFLKLGQIR